MLEWAFQKRRQAVINHNRFQRIALLLLCVLAALAPCLVETARANDTAEAFKTFEPRGWKPHHLKQADGKGGWVVRPAQIQFHHYKEGPLAYNQIKGQGVWAFGVVQMDNSELVLVASWDPEGDQSHGNARDCKDFVSPVACEKPIIAFSPDRGETWSEFRRIPGGEGRPNMRTYLGHGNLTFKADRVMPIMQYFSSDYGRTWTKSELQLTFDGKTFMPCDTNTGVDRDDNGIATRVFEVGYVYPSRPPIGMVRSSTDGGRTWSKEVAPPQWRWEETYRGKTYIRATNEGSIVRAVNGWLVAALRTTLAPSLRPLKNGGLAGTVVSISKDDGATWSPVKNVFNAGRHHAQLLVMPSGDIVMTVILRQDVESGKLASSRRGCEAVVSRDNGQTWDLAHKYILDDFEFSNGLALSTATGHVFSTLLDDGSIITSYGHYPSRGACLIRWRPDSK